MYANITEDCLEKKLKAVGIFNLQLPADALRHMLDQISIPASSLRMLTESYAASSPLSFLMSVFRASSDSKGAQPLGREEMDFLASFSSPEISFKAPSKDDALNNAYPEDDMEWMTEYLPQRCQRSNHSFLATPVIIRRQVLNLPTDYAPLLYLLKPA